MIILGLTGSIGMGKSTAAGMLEILGVPVHDSDAEVHALMDFGAPGHKAVVAAFPYFSYPDIYGKKNRAGQRPLDRQALGALVFKNPQEREKLEGLLHPLVQGAQTAFIKKHKTLGTEIIALDIPLLFETGAETRVDYVLNVTAPAFIQTARVLARPGMNREKLAGILNRQMPDGEKCARADFVIHTGLGRAHTMKQLKKAVAEIKSKKAGSHHE